MGHVINETKHLPFQVLAGGASFLMASMNLGKHSTSRCLCRGFDI